MIDLAVCTVLAEFGIERHFFTPLAILTILVLTFFLFLILFEPTQQYKILPPSYPLASDQFLRLLEALVEA